MALVPGGKSGAGAGAVVGLGVGVVALSFRFVRIGVRNADTFLRRSDLTFPLTVNDPVSSVPPVFTPKSARSDGANGKLTSKAPVDDDAKLPSAAGPLNGEVPTDDERLVTLWDSSSRKKLAVAPSTLTGGSPGWDQCNKTFSYCNHHIQP